MNSYYFDSIGFRNVAEARVILKKAQKENYPVKIIYELQNIIQEYSDYIEMGEFS